MAALVIIVVFLVGGIFIAFLILYIQIREESTASIQMFCSDVDGFIAYTTTLTNPIPSEYDKAVANVLLTTNLNITIANCRDFADDLPLPPGFTTKVALTRIFGDVERTLGYVFYNDALKTILVSFTGTFFFSQWQSDLIFFQVPPTQLNNFEPGIEIHEGFYNIYLSIRDQLLEELKNLEGNNPEQLILSGHSMGGISTIATFDLAKITPKPVNYTFASPRIGNIAFANRYNSFKLNTQRVFNTEDVVPDLPPPVLRNFIYEHVGENIAFTDNLGTLTKNHIDAYEKFVA
uniref:Class 3 lipase n=1 Tax=Pithovirus LCPAC304 TaxID=2506594 RepID=A0A481Z888_9VIRU|nr:MAG: class 3 lipase [Pithovirus LCPAC304]